MYILPFCRALCSIKTPSYVSAPQPHPGKKQRSATSSSIITSCKFFPAQGATRLPLGKPLSNAMLMEVVIARKNCKFVMFRVHLLETNGTRPAGS